MEESKPISLNIEISASNATAEDNNQAARQLQSELKNIGVNSAVMLSSLVIHVLLPAILPAVVETIQSWVSRSSGRSIKFTGKVGGQTIEFEGSPADFKKLITTLEARGLAGDSTTDAPPPPKKKKDK
ncbi:MAG TPA: hypothetical protein PLT08_00690 [Anaerolineales bacterium]|nr:hypothetical protein [Anaerolineales bacterium]